MRYTVSVFCVDACGIFGENDRPMTTGSCVCDVSVSSLANEAIIRNPVARRLTKCEFVRPRCLMSKICRG